MTTVLDWVTVERPDGHSLEVRRAPAAPGEEPLAERLYGTVRVTELGWIARTPDGRSYGPFPTMGEAAYPLARAGEGHPDAALLLGPPIPPTGLQHHPVPAAAPERPKRNRNGLIGMALGVVGIAALVLGRRGAKG
jgi:hypothetical protein